MCGRDDVQTLLTFIILDAMCGRDDVQFIHNSAAAPVEIGVPRKGASRGVRTAHNAAPRKSPRRVEPPALVDEWVGRSRKSSLTVVFSRTGRNRRCAWEKGVEEVGEEDEGEVSY